MELKLATKLVLKRDGLARSANHHPFIYMYHNSACPRHCALVVRLVVHVCPPHRRLCQLYACPFDRTRPDRQGYGLIMRRCLSPYGEHESSQDKVKSLPLHHRRQTKANQPMGALRMASMVNLRTRRNRGQTKAKPLIGATKSRGSSYTV